MWIVHDSHLLMTTKDNFEMASLPTTTPEERRRLLSFVICGGGPTGVETAAVRLHSKNSYEVNWRKFMQEIYDFCQEDITNYVGVLAESYPYNSDRTVASFQKFVGKRFLFI